MIVVFINIKGKDMKKEFTYNELRGLVNENVEKVLKEYVDGDMPGMSKNPKVALAQTGAFTKSIGVNKPDGSFSEKWLKNGSAYDQMIKRNGGESISNKDSITTLLRNIRFGNDEQVEDAGKKFAKMLHNNEKLFQKVKGVLSDDENKHYEDYKKWNK